MDWQRTALRVGSWAVASAIVLRLIGSGIPGQLLEWLRQPETAAVILYLETGKIFRAPPEETLSPTEPPDTPTDPAADPPTFSPEDAELVYVRDTSGNTADIAGLLTEPLEWDLTAGDAAVLIYHTHATESYTRVSGEAYAESGEYRTLDTGYNLVSIGDRMRELLTAAGIGVLHDETLHDYPSYDGGYDNSRATLQDALEQHPEIRLALDVHRDAAADEDGNQFATYATVNGRESAQIMFLISAGHPNWQENMALAVKLTALLEKMYPGITRGILTRTYDYNQDLTGGGLLVEIGAAGDTHDKALVAAEALTEAIILLAKGSA